MVPLKLAATRGSEIEGPDLERRHARSQQVTWGRVAGVLLRTKGSTPSKFQRSPGFGSQGHWRMASSVSGEASFGDKIGSGLQLSPTSILRTRRTQPKALLRNSNSELRRDMSPGPTPECQDILVEGFVALACYPMCGSERSLMQHGGCAAITVPHLDTGSEVHHVEFVDRHNLSMSCFLIFRRNGLPADFTLHGNCGTARWSTPHLHQNAARAVVDCASQSGSSCQGDSSLH